MKNLKDKANETYYNSGETILTDKEFDLLADNGLEIKSFHKKVKHFQPMGSLNKIKTEKEFNKWFNNANICKVSPKLDGNSVELIFENKKLIQAITRGNGFEGNDITEKIKYTKYKLPLTNELQSIKCEAILPKEFQTKFDKNIRNIVAGVLNKKDIDIDILKEIHVIDFNSIWLYYTDLNYNLVEGLFQDWKENFYFEIDGIVVELIEKIHEEKDPLLPTNILALKFNKKGVDAEIGFHSWKLGKHSKLTPVLILKEAVEIDGTQVKRVSASNYSLLKAAGLGIGAKVKVIKSGDIIPYISEVIEPSKEIQIVTCPECGVFAEINESKVDLICPNEHCQGKTINKLQHIFKIFDLEFISDATVKTLYYNGFEHLEDFFKAKEEDFTSVEGFGKRKSQNIISKLKNLKITESQVLECAQVHGIGRKQCEKLIEHFGLDKFLNGFIVEEDIEKIDSFGEIHAKTIIKNLENFDEMYNVILDCKIKIKKNNFTKKENKVNIVFTGKCEQYGRKELTNLLNDKGYNVQSGIKKDTNILLTNDINSNSSKLKKAKEYNIKIIDYNNFFKGIEDE